MTTTLVPRRVSRPGTPGYFKAAEQGYGLLAWDDACQQLAAARNVWVTTASADGRPHAMPVWGIWTGGEFMFSTSPASRKARNLYENPHAAVHLESGNRVVVIEGTAREVRDLATLQAFLALYNPKYQWDFTPDQVSRGVFAVRPVKAFAWLDGEGDGFSGAATRWEF
jgi:nitroimidazol reductase NimA-like FMN-containing flavoprotein (pyridoxamine 5'-phosphate oxidase superfamily)